jgi:hypothetical protein
LKLVVLTMRLFDSPRTGGELCTARLLQALGRAGHTLTIIGLGQGPRRPAAGQRWVSVGEWLPAYADMATSQRLLMPLMALALGRPVTTQRLHGPGSAARVQRELQAALGTVDGLIVDHLQSLSWARPLLDQLPAPMVVMHNLEAQVYAERADAVAGSRLRARASRWVLRREARVLQQLEDLALRHAGVVAALTDGDARALRERAQALGHALPVEVLPGYTLQWPGSAAAAPAGALDRAALRRRLAALPPEHRRIGLIGTWTWEPNRAGLAWMLEQVLPALPADCQLVLAGGGLEHLQLPPGVTALGRVAEVDDFYEAIDLVAIPSVQGSGVHEKAIEAIGRGLPVVASRHALRGLLEQLPAQLPAHVHLADGAEGFAAACATAPLVRDTAAGHGWAAQREQAYQGVLQHCLASLPQPDGRARAPGRGAPGRPRLATLRR